MLKIVSDSEYLGFSKLVLAATSLSSIAERKNGSNITVKHDFCTSLRTTPELFLKKGLFQGFCQKTFFLHIAR